MSTKRETFQVKDYRGATIEDLDIPPAISINPSTNLNEALEISYEHEFTYLPIIHETNKRLLGVLNIDNLRKKPQLVHDSSLEPLAKNFMIWFSQKARRTYEKDLTDLVQSRRTPLNTKIIKPRPSNGKAFQMLTPLSPLEDLESFFQKGYYFAIITNDDGTFVYGVATPEDLAKFEKSRPKL